MAEIIISPIIEIAEARAQAKLPRTDTEPLPQEDAAPAYDVLALF